MSHETATYRYRCNRCKKEFEAMSPQAARQATGRGVFCSCGNIPNLLGRVQEPAAPKILPSTRSLYLANEAIGSIFSDRLDLRRTWEAIPEDDKQEVLDKLATRLSRALGPDANDPAQPVGAPPLTPDDRALLRQVLHRTTFDWMTPEQGARFDALRDMLQGG